MSMTTGACHGESREIGKLWFAGDWACTRGDLETLGYVARCLLEHAPEPLHCELAAIAELCASDPERATEAWAQLKARVQSAVEGAAR